jgi:hypothetical protein
MGGQDIMVDPQVFLPFVQKDNTYLLEALTAPDFVVAVHIIFETSDGMSFHFSKCFVPRVEVVDHTTANKKVVNIINNYAAKCNKEESTGTLANDPSVPVYNPDGFPLVGKTLEMYYLIN